MSTPNSPPPSEELPVLRCVPRRHFPPAGPASSAQEAAAEGSSCSAFGDNFSLDTAATVKPSFLGAVSGEVEGRSDWVFNVHSNEWLKGRTATEVVQYLVPSIMG